MEETSFSDFCQNFLKNPELGSLPFFQDSTQTYTYKQLIESALCRAHYFINSHDTFFALKLESSYKLFTHLLGAIFAQKNVLILSSKMPASSIARLQENIPFTIVLNDQDPETPSRDFIFPQIEINSTKPAFFILSSGSSGPAKGIPLSLHNVFHSAKSIIDFFSMTSTDTSFSNLPHHHIGGLMIFWRAFFSMGKVTTLETGDYQFISLVPLQLQRIINEGSKIKKLSECRGVLIGGAPLASELRLLAIKNKIPIFETYGMSETCSLVMLNGKALSGQIIKLDENGYFLIKGPTLSSSVPVDIDGFYHTKDIGILNLDGTFSFKHRGDLLFKSGGELVNPQEIEAHTKELSWISEAIVVHIKHHEWTQAGAMVYKTIDSTKNQNDLKEHLKKHLHPHLVPKYFIEAPNDLIQEGIKPARFEIAKFAQKFYFKELFHHLYIPNPCSKRLMVFFHGFMEDHTDLIPLMDNHKETSYLFIDLPGHGKTKINSFKNRASVFSELKSLIEFYNTEAELILYGYSMGGRIAIELTLMGLHPSKLILESAHFGLNSKAEKELRLNSDFKLFSKRSENLKAFFDEWYKNPIFGNYNKSKFYHIDVEKKLSHNTNEWQKSLEYFSPGANPFEQTDVLNQLSTQKIIGIVGLEDKKYKEHFEEMRSKLSELSIYEIEHCAHNPHKTHLSEIKKILGLID